MAHIFWGASSIYRCYATSSGKVLIDSEHSHNESLALCRESRPNPSLHSLYCKARCNSEEYRLLQFPYTAQRSEDFGQRGRHALPQR
jgi:hypothetical protein